MNPWINDMSDSADAGQQPATTPLPGPDAAAPVAVQPAFYSWVTAATTSPQPAASVWSPPSQPQAPRPERRRRASRAVIAGLLALSFLGGGLGGGLAGSLITAGNQANGSASLASPAQGQPIARQVAAGDLSAVFQAVSPAVVEISTSSLGRRGQPAASGTGSGFVVDAAGLIMTNQHVVAGASALTVRFSTGEERSATVVGQDTAHDLALIQVDSLPAGVPVAALGDSDEVRVGEVAIAIGSPFGLEQTMTQGIVSAVDRTWSTGTSIHRNLIQTDAPINPGNSGGPLLNAQGEVIGISTMIESPIEGNVGIGFAVPINVAQEQLALLAGGAQVEQGFMGVSLEDAAGQSGVTISAVEAGSGAERAGLLAGDVITAIDGVATVDYPGVAGQISGKQPGAQVAVTIRRAGQEREVTVTLQARPTQG
ncbi:MAG TPA: trypsin-like peptidase domain-containing protein [Herpetosiphonaceae bacterium]|nr:trypsin-like peptidase domain-containing protein [Herpetosiphonaceae bacterium]